MKKKRIKGCLNCNCEDYKKTQYKETDELCAKCGTKLSYVCKNKKCFKQIPDDAKEAYCPNHIAERKDKRDENWGKAKKVLGFAVAIGAAAVGGKSAFDNIGKK